jgi:two-component system response regulator
MTQPASPLRLLLVEDNPADVRLTAEALRDSGSGVTLSVARDGVEALDMLTASHRTLPDLILLDLNLPRRDGRDVLRAIKADEALSHVPIVILTTSSADNDVRDSYRLGANAYVIKPVDLDRFFAVIAAIRQFWMQTVRLPTQRRNP